jgi:aspartokinase-like uncharacterized kinase
MADKDGLITTAEKDIAKILAKLEEDTGAIVAQVEVRDMEVTCVDDQRPQWLRSVMINMRRVPGTRWSTQ